jgi:hypothetical protein
MRERSRRTDHAVALSTQGRQPQRHLARKPLHPSELGADRSAAVDRDCVLVVRVLVCHYSWSLARRRTRNSAPAPISAIPKLAPSHASNPVRGSAPADGSPELDEDVVPVLVALTVPVLEEDEATGELDPSVTDVDELEEPEELVLDEVEELEPEELEPEVEPEELGPEPDECEPERFDPPSGSTYCWSPADGPLASAVAGPTRTSADRTQSQLSVMRAERTSRVLQAMRLLALGVASKLVGA